jgi:hypothetical protein
MVAEGKEGCSFLKKEPRNFCSLAYVAQGHVCQMEKVLGFFFSKKNAFLNDRATDPGTAR